MRVLLLVAFACLLQGSLASCHRHRKHKDKAVAVKPRAAKPAPAKRPPMAAEIKHKYATILAVKPQTITNIALYQFIDNWYGTRYRTGGTSRAGIDCSGFVQKLYSDIYHSKLLRTTAEQFSSCRFIKHSSNAIEGDLVFFRINSRQVTHVGVYLANDHFVHASTSGGVMISSLREDYWQKYFSGCGRFPRAK